VRPVDVLVVEDNRGDVVLMREAMRKASLSYRVTVITDGMEALDFLHRRGMHAGAPRPELILLDLKLPGKTGGEVLEDIMSDPSLRGIPVVLLSSSQSELERARSRGLPAECHMPKPESFEGYVAVVQAIEAFRQRSVTERPHGDS
jgi:two-component system, chemotaxis family, response regulator Rcp1